MSSYRGVWLLAISPGVLFFPGLNTGDDKEFPCISHTHTHTHTAQLPSPHQTWHIPKALQSLKAVAVEASAGNGHGLGLSAPRPTDLIQRHLYLEPSNQDLHLRPTCPDLILGKGRGTRRPFSPLGPFSSTPRLLSPSPLAHSLWGRRDLLSRAPQARRHAQGLHSSPWPSPCCTMLRSGTGEGPCFLKFGPLVLLQLSDQRLDCFFHLAFKKTLFKKKIFIGVKLLYNVVLVSTVK